MENKKVLKDKKQNNILIGEKIAISKDIPNIGALILKVLMTYKEDEIGLINPITPQESVNYHTMKMNTMMLALWMRKQSVASGDVIAICSDNILESYVPLFASLYVGAIINPWHASSEKEHVENFFKQVVPKIIFASGEAAVIITEIVLKLKLKVKVVHLHIYVSQENFDFVFILPTILSQQRAGNETKQKIKTFKCTKLRSIVNDTAMIVFSNKTSVSTCVNIPYTIFTSPVNRQIPTMQANKIGMFLTSDNLPFYLILIVRAILSHVKLVWVPEYIVDYKERICQLIEKYKVNWLIIDSTKSEEFCKSGVFIRYNISSLETLIINGGPIKPSIHKGLTNTLPDLFVLSLYSLPETGVIAYQRVPGKFGSSGSVGANVRLKIIDLDSKKPLGPYENGEICCKCDSMMTGYYKYVGNTNGRAIDNEGWYRTGDMGYYDDKGDLVVFGRIKEIIKYKNHNISAIELENVIKSHKAIQEVAVMPLPDATNAQHPVAFVTTKPELQVIEQELKDFVAAQVEDYKKLRGGVIFMDDMHHLPNGTIDRKYLTTSVKNNLAKDHERAKDNDTT